MFLFPSIFIIVRNRAYSEQAGKIVGVYGVAQEKRPGHMEDFLHGAQIRRVREKNLAGKRDAVSCWGEPGVKLRSPPTSDMEMHRPADLLEIAALVVVLRNSTGPDQVPAQSFVHEANRHMRILPAGGSAHLLCPLGGVKPILFPAMALPNYRASGRRSQGSAPPHQLRWRQTESSRR
jgi:hypothetical protein